MSQSIRPSRAPGSNSTHSSAMQSARRLRRRLLAVAAAAGLAAGLLLAVSVMRSGAEQMGAVPKLEPAFTAAAAGVSQKQSSEYLVKSYNGQVCVFADGGAMPQQNTGIYTATLPAEDQVLLQVGILVASQAELSALLEDYGYGNAWGVSTQAAAGPSACGIAFLKNGIAISPQIEYNETRIRMPAVSILVGTAPFVFASVAEGGGVFHEHGDEQ